MTVQKPIPRGGNVPIETVIATGPVEDEGFGLADLRRIFRVRRGIILGTALVLLALTTVITFQLTPLYDATAIVMLDQRKNNVADVDAVLSGLPTDQSSIETQVQLLRSQTLLTHVVDKAHLEADPEFNPPPGNRTLVSLVSATIGNWLHMAVPAASTVGEPLAATDDALDPPEERSAEATRIAIINRLAGRITALAQGRSTAIQLRCRSIDPVKAARICNAVADAYVEDQLNAKFDATQKTSQWLADRLQQLSGQVQAADSAVQQYKAQYNINDTGTGMSVVEQQLAQLNGQLVLAKSALAEQEAKYARMREMQSSGRSADVSQVVASPLIAQLRQQETDLLRQEAELSSRYGPRHPKMLDLQSQKENLQAKINEEVRRVVETVANDVVVARARVGSLQSSVQQATVQTQNQNRDKVKLKELEAAALSTRSLYDAFLGRFKETQGQEAIQAPDARVITRAQAPRQPSFPNKMLVFAIAFPGSLVIGFLFGLLAEQLDNGFRTTAQVENVLGLPVLSTLPEIKGLSGGGRSVAERVISKPMSAFSEAIRGLQMGLTLSNIDSPPKVVIVTSSVPDEGKTTVAISLARMAAQSGQRVVIIDGDLRRQSVAKTFGVRKMKNGMVEALTGAAPLEQCLAKDPKSNAVLLPVAHKPANPGDILGSAMMKRLIAQLRTACDLIVIDSAPVLPVNDTKMLTPLADAVVFVTRWEKTPREAAQNAVRSLASVGAPIAGVVLARTNTSRFQYYAYGYQSYHGYNKYYAE